MKLKLNTENIVVYFDKVNQWLYVSCSNQLTLNEVQEGFGECLDMIKEYNCTRLLIDSYSIRYSFVLSEINRWLVNEWLSAASEEGLQYVAQFSGTEAEWQLFETKTLPEKPPTVKVATFHSLVHAVKWMYSHN